MVRLVVEIEGMHCGACATLIEQNLKKLKGVKDATASFMLKKAFVETNGKVKPDLIKTNISESGYGVKHIYEEDEIV